LILYEYYFECATAHRLQYFPHFIVSAYASVIASCVFDLYPDILAVFLLLTDKYRPHSNHYVMQLDIVF